MKLDTGSILDLVREALPVEGLDEEQLVDVAAATVVQRYPAGTTIIHQGGAPAAGLYVIRTGHVEIRADGLLLDMPGPSEVFGELSLVSGAPPTATVRASEEVECLLIDRSAAESVLGTGSGVAFVQASLRRSLSRSLDTDGRSFVEAIENADDVEAAVSALRELPGGVCSLVAGGADATKVGRVVSSAVDALTRRLLASAIHELGEPPVPWAWLALGSEARLEQALHTDQDHALAYDPGDRTAGELDPFFAELAERVTTGLELAGIPRCNGDAMAVHPGLRRPIDAWGDAIRGWMADPGVDGSILSSIVFDFRRVDGPLDAEPQLHAVVSTAATAYPQFVRHLTGRALDRKPPTGFRKNLVVESKGDHAGRLDIKHGGVTIVSNIARVFAIAGGRAQKGTLDRLRVAEADGRIDADRRQALDEAFRLLWQIRLEHQVGQVERGEVPDDFVDPATLGPIARLGLKEAFTIVTNEQQMLAAEANMRF
jgi:signal-transduction protein with cAMP-binding, CBS, and nucleotidyltransferase domain